MCYDLSGIERNLSVVSGLIIVQRNRTDAKLRLGRLNAVVLKKHIRLNTRRTHWRRYPIQKARLFKRKVHFDNELALVECCIIMIRYKVCM